MADWTVPPAFVEANAAAPERLDWAATAPGLAARLADEWSLAPDGPARAGHMGAVWPVRDADDRPLVLKLGCDPVAVAAEANALSAWAGRGTAAGLERADTGAGAILLERLDADRDLTADIEADEATRIIADLLARSATPAPDGVPAYAGEAERVRTSIEAHRTAKGEVVPAFAVDAALDTLAELAASRDRRLLHFDAHYRNVLPTLPGAADPGWRLIDPLPHAGPPEIETVAALRNRFGEACGTGDPDRALRRRLALFADRLGLDPGLARRTAHAIAVDNLLWLLPDRADHPFVGPYRVMLGWVR